MCKMRYLFFFATMLAAAVALAQTDRGTIVGTVKDSTNALLPGARVEVKESGHAVVSDAQGQFLIPNLPAGNYT